LAIPKCFKHVYDVYFLVDFLYAFFINFRILAATAQPSEAEELHPLSTKREFDAAM
jgi:hypothetical protein